VPAAAHTIHAGDDRLHFALVDRAVEPTPTPDERARAIDALVAMSGSRREPLERARAEFQRRLAWRSDDFDATQGLRVVEGALGLVDRPGGLWAPPPPRRGRRRR
jgi:hypothetical protein